MLAAAEAIVDVGVHHPAVADVELVTIPTPVAPGMDPLPANPAEPDKSPTSIRCPLISRCESYAPVPGAVRSVFDVAGQHSRACLTTAAAVHDFVGRRCSRSRQKTRTTVRFFCRRRVAARATITNDGSVRFAGWPCLLTASKMAGAFGGH